MLGEVVMKGEFIRRPLVLLAILLTVISFFITSEVQKKRKDIKLEIKDKEVVLNIEVKEFYTKVSTKNYFLYFRKLQKDRINIGDVLEFSGTTKSDVINSGEEDEFNFYRYVRSCGKKEAVDVTSCKRVGRSNFFTIVGRLKSYCRDTNRYLYREESSILNSLVIGDKSDLDEKMMERFRRAGTSHILAISGLHMDIIFGAVMFIVGNVMKKSRLFFVSALIIFYWMVSGFAISALRAIIMVFVLNFSSLIYKRNDGLSTLALAYLCIVSTNIWAIYNVGLQLSFAACLSAILFTSRIKKILKSTVLSLSISCNILVLPLVVYYFKGSSIVFALGNIFTVPFIGTVMMLDIISLFLFKLSLTLASVVSFFAKILLKIIMWFNTWTGDFSFSYINFRSLGLKFIFIYYIIIFTIVIYVYRKNLRESFNGVQRFYARDNE